MREGESPRSAHEYQVTLLPTHVLLCMHVHVARSQRDALFRLKMSQTASSRCPAAAVLGGGDRVDRVGRVASETVRAVSTDPHEPPL